MEFLIGRTLSNALLSLGIYDGGDRRIFADDKHQLIRDRML
jgi:hypothetical protein